MNHDTCNLCPEPEQTHRVVTHDYKTLMICPDCLRRFGVDEWHSVENLITGTYRVNDNF